jgi:hypothetical protein
VECEDNARATLGQRLNIAPSGKRFSSEFIEPGLVSYLDNPNGAIELLRKETIDEALSSMIDASLTIGHPRGRFMIDWQPADVANGKVDAVSFNAQTGFYCCEGPVDTDQARAAIGSGKRPSCGYDVLEVGPGGSWHNMPYVRELTKIRFHHLAIVDNPRYEDSTIRLNSKETNTMPPKWLQKLTKLVKDAAGVETKTTEVRENALTPDSVLNLGNGKTATVKQLVEAQEKADLEAARTNACVAIGDEDEIEYGGKRYNAKALIARFNEGGMKEKTAEQIEQERSNAVAEKAKKDKAEQDRLEAEARENERKKQAGAAHFENLRSAKDTRDNAAPTYDLGDSGSLDGGVALGRERYGRAPQNGRN